MPIKFAEIVLFSDMEELGAISDPALGEEDPVSILLGTKNYYKILDGDQEIGYIGYTLREVEGIPVALMRRLYIKQPLQGHGKGKVAVKAFIAVMRKAGTKYLFGYIRDGPTKERLVRFYKGLGFRPTNHPNFLALGLRGWKKREVATLEAWYAKTAKVKRGEVEAESPVEPAPARRGRSRTVPVGAPTSFEEVTTRIRGILAGPVPDPLPASVFLTVTRLEIGVRNDRAHNNTFLVRTVRGRNEYERTRDAMVVYIGEERWGELKQALEDGGFASGGYLPTVDSYGKLLTAWVNVILPFLRLLHDQALGHRAPAGARGATGTNAVTADTSAEELEARVRAILASPSSAGRGAPFIVNFGRIHAELHADDGEFTSSTTSTSSGTTGRAMEDYAGAGNWNRLHDAMIRAGMVRSSHTFPNLPSTISPSHAFDTHRRILDRVVVPYLAAHATRRATGAGAGRPTPEERRPLIAVPTTHAELTTAIRQVLQVAGAGRIEGPTRGQMFTYAEPGEGGNVNIQIGVTDSSEFVGPTNRANAFRDDLIAYLGTEEADRVIHAMVAGGVIRSHPNYYVNWSNAGSEQAGHWMALQIAEHILLPYVAYLRPPRRAPPRPEVEVPTREAPPAPTTYAQFTAAVRRVIQNVEGAGQVTARTDLMFTATASDGTEIKVGVDDTSHFTGPNGSSGMFRQGLVGYLGEEEADRVIRAMERAGVKKIIGPTWEVEWGDSITPEKGQWMAIRIANLLLLPFIVHLKNLQIAGRRPEPSGQPDLVETLVLADLTENVRRLIANPPRGRIVDPVLPVPGSDLRVRASEDGILKWRGTGHTGNIRDNLNRLFGASNVTSLVDAMTAGGLVLDRIRGGGAASIPKVPTSVSGGRFRQAVMFYAAREMLRLAARMQAEASPETATAVPAEWPGGVPANYAEVTQAVRLVLRNPPSMVGIKDLEYPIVGTAYTIAVRSDGFTGWGDSSGDNNIENFLNGHIGDSETGRLLTAMRDGGLVHRGATIPVPPPSLENRAMRRGAMVIIIRDIFLPFVKRLHDLRARPATPTRRSTLDIARGITRANLAAAIRAVLESPVPARGAYPAFEYLIGSGPGRITAAPGDNQLLVADLSSDQAISALGALIGPEKWQLLRNAMVDAGFHSRSSFAFPPPPSELTGETANVSGTLRKLLKEVIAPFIEAHRTTPAPAPAPPARVRRTPLVITRGITRGQLVRAIRDIMEHPVAEESSIALVPIVGYNFWVLSDGQITYNAELTQAKTALTQAIGEQKLELLRGAMIEVGFDIETGDVFPSLRSSLLAPANTKATVHKVLLEVIKPFVESHTRRRSRMPAEGTHSPSPLPAVTSAIVERLHRPVSLFFTPRATMVLRVEGGRRPVIIRVNRNGNLTGGDNHVSTARTALRDAVGPENWKNLYLAMVAAGMQGAVLSSGLDRPLIPLIPDIVEHEHNSTTHRHKFPRTHRFGTMRAIFLTIMLPFLDVHKRAGVAFTSPFSPPRSS